VVAVLPSLPGFLVQVSAISGAGLSPLLLGVYNYAWFAGFGIAFVVYLALRALAPRR
jgi:NCS1 family nucleobase:cation symporter-1